MDTLFDRYPDAPGAKTSGPSQEAANAVKPRALDIRLRVLQELRGWPNGLTADECAANLGLSVLSVRPRFSELSKQGLIFKTYGRRTNASGMSATVWRARDAA